MSVHRVTIANEKCVNSMKYCIVKTIRRATPFVGNNKNCYLFIGLMGLL